MYNVETKTWSLTWSLLTLCFLYINETKLYPTDCLYMHTTSGVEVPKPLNLHSKNHSVPRGSPTNSKILGQKGTRNHQRATTIKHIEMQKFGHKIGKKSNMIINETQYSLCRNYDKNLNFLTLLHLLESIDAPAGCII